MSGPTIGVGVGGVADLQGARRSRASVSTTWSKTLRWTMARVGAVQIWPEWKRPRRADAADGGLDVGVVEDEARTLAAELEEEALHRARPRLGDAHADLGRAGEADHVDVRSTRRARRRARLRRRSRG